MLGALLALTLIDLWPLLTANARIKEVESEVCKVGRPWTDAERELESKGLKVWTTTAGSSMVSLPRGSILLNLAYKLTGHLAPSGANPLLNYYPRMQVEVVLDEAGGIVSAGDPFGFLNDL